MLCSAISRSDVEDMLRSSGMNEPSPLVSKRCMRVKFEVENSFDSRSLSREGIKQSIVCIIIKWVDGTKVD